VDRLLALQPRRRLHPAAANLVAASALVPLSLAVDGAWPAPWRAPLGWAVVLYAAGPITLGHLWFYQVVRRLGPGRTATFLNLMPFVVIALAWALLGEAVHAYPRGRRRPRHRGRGADDDALRATSW